MSRRIEIDSLKGFAILGVLILHSSFSNRLSPQTILLVQQLQIIFDWSVLAFFFASGVLFKSGSNLLKEIQKGLFSYIIPFVIYNIAYNLLFHLVDWWNPNQIRGFSDSFNVLTIGFISPAYQLYFLPYLFAIQALFLSAIFLFHWKVEKLVAYSFIAVAFLFYFLTEFPGVSHGSEFHKLPLYFSAFSLGIINRSNQPNHIRTYIQSAGVILLMLLSLYIHVPIAVISLLIPFMLLISFSCVRINKALALFAILGKRSGSLYLWHTPLLMPFINIILTKAKLPSLLNYSMTILITIGICILIHSILKRFNHVVVDYITL